MKRPILVAIAVLIGATSATAATFVVPSDEELVVKARAITTGVVEGSYVQESNGTIETVYEIRAERALKGAIERNELLRVVSIGGVIDDRGLLAPGEAHYNHGERVVVFLTRDERGRWRTTDLTLGRFVFRTSTKGERLLVRDMEDVIGWDAVGRRHQEQLRREAGFLRFIETRANGGAGRTAPASDGDSNYLVSASEVTFEEDQTYLKAQAQATTYPASTYTSFVNNQPVRWATMANGVPVYKRSDQNIAGASDGGVSVIQNALAAWTNECGSLINLTYAGQVAKASANHDGTSVVEFNDPQGRISGSWGGSGTVGIAFLSFAGTHTFQGATWLSITDMDVVFQDGYTAANASFAAAMTHEVGHGLGWRHSNQNHATGGACNSAVEECTSVAIMNSVVNANYGYTLQPWDVNAAQSVYPGGSCTPTCTAPAITSQPPSQTVSAGTNVTLNVTATGTSTLTYQWYTGATGNTSNPISGASGPSLTVAPSFTTSYWVRVTNACGAASSNTATVTVSITGTAPTTASGLYVISPCRLFDTRDPVGSHGGPAVGANSGRTVTAVGRCGIPSGAKSIVLNITAAAPSTNGTVTVYPGTGSGPPNASTLSYKTGRNLANNATILLSSDGKLSLYNQGTADVHLIIDVNGYFQ